MEKFQILVSVIFTLWKCEELTMLNVTFHNIKESWKDAAKFCLHKGGVLESNVTLLREQDEFKNATAYMWLGKYRTFTNWTYVRGCFLINGNFQHFEIELSNTAELQCQMLCDKYKFYSIKGADCYCIEDIDSFARSANCNCVGCYKVWEHRLPDFGTAKKNEKCIAAIQCVSNKLKRRYVKCDTKYDVTCDNDAELGYTYDNYQAVAEECEGQGSFIKWYSDNVCAIQGFSEHWTSGTRQNKIFLLRKAYVTENLQPGKCFILKKDKDREEKENCKNKHLPFFCRFEKDEDKGDIISIPNLSMPQKNVQSDDLGSIAAGTVTSIIVVIVVISVLVFIHRRRLSKKTPTLHESQNNSRLQDTVGLPSNYETSKAPVYYEIDAENFGPHSGKLNCSRAVNNITYDQVNSYKIPKSQNVNQSTNSSILTNLNSLELQRNVDPDEYEMAKVINVTGNSSEGVHSSNYCLAKPITSNTEEESDPYDINRDYDHLNNVKKKEDPITKVYDHLPTTVTDDPTYDHSNLKSVLDNDGYYDHFTIDGADV
ncbi:uncharacterized protein LOC127732057 [Mytilus californianus]|uniref:uncharacterized protein LOC127732057 n=1 Tax=Mytilus californianus TaxID=6549 RepID=UPI0022476A38|nr:uncharacterized protein LOC127732057 [Mytilus californianus]